MITYRIRPGTHLGADVYWVERVRGLAYGGTVLKEYGPFYSAHLAKEEIEFQRQLDDDKRRDRAGR